jgi:hypothetical protein
MIKTRFNLPEDYTLQVDSAGNYYLLSRELRKFGKTHLSMSFGSTVIFFSDATISGPDLSKKFGRELENGIEFPYVYPIKVKGNVICNLL